MNKAIRARLIGGPNHGTEMMLPRHQHMIQVAVLTDPVTVDVRMVTYVAQSIGELVVTYEYEPADTRPYCRVPPIDIT